MATIVTRAGKGAALTHQEVDANFTGLNTELGQKEVASNKGVANGYASLDAAGKVPSAQLPSYVDDVVEVANFASLPGTGETGKIYVTIDTNKTYRWTGSTYIEISASPGSTDSLAEGSTNLYLTQARARSSVSASGSLSYNSSTGVMSFTDAVTSVAGRSGAVTLTSSDVGLGNVENKSSSTIRGEITSGNVTTALGFTPYNATNPSGYITSSSLSSYLPLSGGTITGTALQVGTAFTYDNPGGWNTNIVAAGSAHARFRLRATSYAGSGDRETYLWLDNSVTPSTGMYSTASTFAFGGSIGTVQVAGNTVLHAGNASSYSIPVTGGINITGSYGLNDSRLYLRTNGDTNHYLWNAEDDWEELVAYSGSGFRVKSSNGTSLMTFSTGAVNSGVALQQGGNQVLHAGNYTSYTNPSGNLHYVNSEYNATISSNGWYTIAEYGSGRAQATFHIFDQDSSRHNYVRVNVVWSFGNGGAYVVSAGRHGSSTIRHVRLLYNTSDQTYGGVKVQVYCENADWGSWVLRVRQETLGISGWGAFTQVTPTLANSVSSFAEYSRASNANDNGWLSVPSGLYIGGNTTLHAGNYQDYSPTKTGGGASGTWGINVTGTAGSISGYNNPTTSATGNTIVYRDGNADIFGRYIFSVHVNQSSGNSENPGVSQVMVTNGSDNYLRKASIGHFTSYVQSNASGTWGITASSANKTNANSGYARVGYGMAPFYNWGGTNGGSGAPSDSTYTTGIDVGSNPGDQAYGFQIASNMWNVGLWTRTYNSGFSNWVRLLDNSNYTSYAPSLTGSGASGTWGINITGNAATVASLSPSQFFNNMGNNHSTYTDFNNVPGFGAYYVQQGGSSPTGTGSHQWYGFTLGLGNEYALSSYATQLYWPRRAQNSDTYIYVRDREGGGWTSWTKIKSGYADNSGQLNGYSSAESGGSVVLRTASNGYLYLNNWINTGSGGVFSSVNGAHFYPNNTEYGSWRIAGSRAGWHGIYFDSGANLMMNSAEVGFHRAGHGWMMRWMTGTGYVHKGNPGGGTEAVILDSSNYTSYTGGLSSTNNWNGVNYFVANRNTTSDSPALQAFSNNASGAIMSFHRGGYYAVNFGLDSDNVMRIGGWSAAANRWQLDMSGNGTYAGNVTAYSDERLKKDWSPIYDGFVDRLAIIRAGTYTRIDSGERQAGVSAQAMRELLPEVVSEDNEGTLALAYGNAAMVSAVELAKELVALKHKVTELEARIH